MCVCAHADVRGCVHVRVAATLAHEVEQMHEAQVKVELEALAGFGDDFLVDFLVDKIVVRKGTTGGEHVDGERSLSDRF